MPTIRTPQTRKNHVRFDPFFHFVIAPLLGVFLVISFQRAFHSLNSLTVSLAVLSIALFVMAFRLRTYPLKVQDRLIRLEEQLRMAALLPEDLRLRARHLTTGQLVALRFASDAELASLVKLALDQKLTGGQIKDKIVDWRGDYDRV